VRGKAVTREGMIADIRLNETVQRQRVRNVALSQRRGLVLTSATSTASRDRRGPISKSHPSCTTSAATRAMRPSSSNAACGWSSGTEPPCVIACRWATRAAMARATTPWPGRSGASIRRGRCTTRRDLGLGRGLHTNPARPAHRPESRSGKRASDLICPMYPPIDALVRWAVANDPATGGPMILCEYSHAMGNSNGGLGDYWNAFEAHHGLQGRLHLGVVRPRPDPAHRMTAGPSSPMAATSAIRPTTSTSAATASSAPTASPIRPCGNSRPWPSR